MAAELTEEESEKMLPMPRRLLLMLRELHRRGYERLRAVTGLSPSGCHWRLQITAAIGVAAPGVDFMARQNRHVAIGDWLVFARGNHLIYSTGSSPEDAEECFGWKDAAKDSPCQLAEKFIDRFPLVLHEGSGSDPDYARWYADMIEATEPDGLIYMYSDWEMPSDYIPVLNMEGLRISPPPFVVDT